MKINNIIFFLPPYISTTWGNVMALHMKETRLCVSLADGELVQIPGLKQEVIDKVFESHANYLEEEDNLDKAAEQIVQAQNTPGNPFMHIIAGPDSGSMPFHFGMNSLDGMANAMQHNPAQAHTPDLPKEILEKIASIVQAVAPDDPDQIPQAEPHCNCMHCQIARTISNVIENSEELPLQSCEAENVSDTELAFQQWEIEPKSDALFTVTNKLDTKEHYNVFLGKPVGCTCGTDNCEHIIAVLRS